MEYWIVLGLDEECITYGESVYSYLTSPRDCYKWKITEGVLNSRRLVAFKSRLVIL